MLKVVTAVLIHTVHRVIRNIQRSSLVILYLSTHGMLISLLLYRLLHDINTSHILYHNIRAFLYCFYFVWWVAWSYKKAFKINITAVCKCFPNLINNTKPWHCLTEPLNMHLHIGIQSKFIKHSPLNVSRKQHCSGNLEVNWETKLEVYNTEWYYCS